MSILVSKKFPKWIILTQIEKYDVLSCSLIIERVIFQISQEKKHKYLAPT